MLWVISGSHHSGKNTFRNFLARNFGFNIIEKFVLEQTAETVKNVYKRNKQGKKNVAGRDPYLCIPDTSDSRRKLLERIYAAKSEAERKQIKEKEPLSKNIIYDKNGQHYYIISCDRIEDAFKEEQNYLLVCSDTKVISRIKRVHGFEPSKMRTILIFGMNINGDESPKGVAKSAAKKISQYFDFMSKNLQLFDYVIYNQRIDSPQKRDENLMRQFNDILMEEKRRQDSMVRCCKLNTKIDSNTNNIVQSGIFFIKPFSKIKTKQNIEKSRAAHIYRSINVQIESEMKKINKPILYDFEEVSDYFIGDDGALAHIVDYEENKPYPQDDMAKQIEAANLIIADVADFDDADNPLHNPNCYWELGYARAKGKDVIVMVDKNATKSVPFDERNTILFQYDYDGESVVFLDEKGQKSNTFINHINKYLNMLCETAMESVYNRYLIGKDL